MVVPNLDAKPDIILVEDNEDEARLSIMGLRRIDPVPTVMVINDGELALAVLTGASHKPLVVLLDLKLPKVHGLEILAAMKKTGQPNSGVPVLVLTSSDHPIDVRRAHELGCDDYLCKPVDWEQYVKLVCTKTAEHLENSRCA